jgi:hypothetical protein
VSQVVIENPIINSHLTSRLSVRFDYPQFSSDRRYVYFTTPAWTTSPAVHVVDTTNAKEHIVCPGGSVEVLRSGEYRDCLLVQQRHYFFGGGSYDWFWLFRPDGNEIGPVGEDHQPQRALLKKLAGTSADLCFIIRVGECLFLTFPSCVVCYT